MRRRLTMVLAGLAAALGAAPAPAAPTAGWSREVVDPNLAGAAFAIVAPVTEPGADDIVVSGFGTIEGTTIPNGTVALYHRATTGWQKTIVVPPSAGIRFPSEPAAFDVDGDTDLDVVLPGGFFICAVAAPDANCGSLTWWEQRPGPTFVQHTIVAPGAAQFYHRILPIDLDRDGHVDLVTVGETAGTALLQVFPGNETADRFDPTPVPLAVGGGSLPVLADVDGDGDTDVASAQFFDRSASFVWFEQLAGPSPAFRFGTFVRHVMAANLGGSIEIRNVPGIGWVGSNHTNTASGPPGTAASALYLLTPGGDPRLPWTATALTTGIVARADGGLGQQAGAPGVFGAGDADGDGDADLVVSGDADARAFVVRQATPTQFTTEAVDDAMGQAGGARVLDSDDDGRPELLFTSYEQNVVALYRATGTTAGGAGGAAGGAVSATAAGASGSLAATGGDTPTVALALLGAGLVALVSRRRTVTVTPPR